MDLKNKAENSPYFLITSMDKTPLKRFWVVQLDCNIEVYQSVDDPSLDEPNSWMRLKQFCKDNNVKPANMARAGKDLNPDTQINMDPMADAYFYTRRIRKLLTGNPSFSGYQDCSQGVGQLYGDILKIVWELDNGLSFETEERNINDHPKSKPISLIYKN